MGYVDFTFRVHEEDLVKGLLVKLIQAPEGLIPVTWGDFRAAHEPNGTNPNVSDVEVYGGTVEQFEHGKREHAELCKAQGKEQGSYVHLPASS